MFLQDVEEIVEIHGFILDGLPVLFSQLVRTAGLIFFQMKFQTLQMPFDGFIFCVNYSSRF